MLVLALISLLALLQTVPVRNSSDTAVIAYVNGAAVVRSELNHLLGRERANIERLKLYPDSLRSIVDRSVDAAIDMKLQQLLAAEVGLLSDPGYEAFVAAWQAENNARKASKARGEVVYGPLEFSEAAYFDYSFTNMVHQLQTALPALAADTSERNTRALYDSLKESLFQRAPLLRWIRVTPGDTTASTRAGIHHALTTTNDPSALKERFSCGIAFRSTQENQSGYSEDGDAERDVVRTMNPGDVRECSDGAGGTLLLKCLERLPGGYQSYEDVRGVVGRRLREREYHRYLARVRSRASIAIVDTAVAALARELSGGGR